MEHIRHHYVDSAWREPLQPTPIDVVDPSTEEVFAQILGAGLADVDRPVAAAHEPDGTAGPAAGNSF